MRDESRRALAALLAGNYDSVRERAVEEGFIPARRVQFYSDAPFEVGGRRLRALQLFVPILPVEELINSQVLDLVEELDGRANVAFSDAVFDLSTKEPVVFDTVTLDFDVEGGLDLGTARLLGELIIDGARRLVGVEPLIVYSGCRGVHVKYFLRDALPVKYLRPIKLGLYTLAGFGLLGLSLDERTLDAKHVFKPPYVINTKCNRPAVPLNKFDIESHMLDAGLALGLAMHGELLTLERGATPKAPATAGGGGNSNTVVEAWRRLVNTMLDTGFKLYDCRHRFSCLLGRYCVQSGISLDECLELLDKLVVNGSSTPYANRLRYCYNHPEKAEYLPSPWSFLNKDEWYACGNDVAELHEIVKKALAGKKPINTH